MFAAAKSGASLFLENHGQNREAGTDRTSAIALIPALRSIAGKAFRRNIGMTDGKEIERGHEFAQCYTRVIAKSADWAWRRKIL
jgi:hypothetical protein